MTCSQVKVKQLYQGLEKNKKLSARGSWVRWSRTNEETDHSDIYLKKKATLKKARLKTDAEQSFNKSSHWYDTTAALTGISNITLITFYTRLLQDQVFTNINCWPNPTGNMSRYLQIILSNRSLHETDRRLQRAQYKISHRHCYYFRLILVNTKFKIRVIFVVKKCFISDVARLIYVFWFYNPFFRWRIYWFKLRPSGTSTSDQIKSPLNVFLKTRHFTVLILFDMPNVKKLPLLHLL